MLSALFNYRRRPTCEVHIGNTPLGGENPLRVQSMTNTSTMDTDGCVEQALRIAQAGGHYVRLTTQGLREARNLLPIKEALRRRGCTVPLVADVHFNANVADLAATVVEKVRINPGNYVDPARTFRHIDYTDEEYATELHRIEGRFVPLLHICKEHGTALRIGVNHGSLSDRIMSRYGDTPAGMVESCLEFLRICVREQFTDVVISIKASNTVVMVCTVRLLVQRMDEEGMHFPLHLGVTEAGEGEDGRIKSAVGIGTLLSDGLGDTIRVSLSEAPEAEIPVARKLCRVITARAGHQIIPGLPAPDFNYLSPTRRPTQAVGNIGGNHPPVVIANLPTGLSPKGDTSPLPDWFYAGSLLPSIDQLAVCRQRGIGILVDAPALIGQPAVEGLYPAFTPDALPLMGMTKADCQFLFVSYPALSEEVRTALRLHPETVVIAQSNHQNPTGELRALVHELWHEGITNPVVIYGQYAERQPGNYALHAAADLGALCIDQLADGLFLSGYDTELAAHTAFGILQAARLRTTKTEFISCPGCGRTLYHLQDTIARIKTAVADRAAQDPRWRTLKIGIMGCIVNGPGEMADADFGYVGAAAGKVSLYRGKHCIEKNIPEEEAVDRLIQFIANNL